MDVNNLWLLSGAKEVEEVLAMHLYPRQWLAIDGLGTCKGESRCDFLAASMSAVPQALTICKAAIWRCGCEALLEEQLPVCMCHTVTSMT